ncbi:MAG: TVP38/TMEM64 family protein [Halospina sp.]
MKDPHTLNRLLLLVILGITLTGLWFLLRELGMPGDLSTGGMAVWLNAQGAAGPLLLMLVMVMAVVIGPIPTLPVSAAAGMAFGVVGGTLVASAGALAGALASFAISRFLARDLVRRKLGDNPLFQEQAPQKVLFWGVFVTRLVPLFSFALVSYAAGLTVISTWRYALATYLGMLPMTVVFVTLGRSFQVHPVAATIASAVLLVAMFLAPYYLQRFHRERLRRFFQ